LRILVPAHDPDCSDVLVVIQCYADGECDLETAFAITVHLELCSDCQQQLLTLRWLKAAVRRCCNDGRQFDASESRAWLSSRMRSA
jgi:anti-sigma factor (TIGR02949 family)